jgi:hypothetical protein
MHRHPEAVQPGHAQIQENYVRDEFTRNGERGVAVTSSFYRVAVEAEKGRRAVGNVHAVVDYENASLAMRGSFGGLVIR